MCKAELYNTKKASAGSNNRGLAFQCVMRISADIT